MTQKLLEQTRKLIALAVNNPSEEEARSAARKACILIHTNGLTLSDATSSWASTTESTTGRQEPGVPDWTDALAVIEQMCRSGDFDWASGTLRGIQDWVKVREHITAKQWRAVQNIRRCR